MRICNRDLAITIRLFEKIASQLAGAPVEVVLSRPKEPGAKQTPDTARPKQKRVGRFWRSKWWWPCGTGD